MNEGITDDLERRLQRTHLVALHALTELAIKKGLFSREEFRASCQWFDGIFHNLDALLTNGANKDLSKPNPELQALYNRIQERLFQNG